MNSESGSLSYYNSMFNIWLNKECHVPLPGFVTYLIPSHVPSVREFTYVQHQYNGLRKRFKSIESCLSNDPENTIYLEERKQTLLKLSELDIKLKDLMEKINEEESVIQDREKNVTNEKLRLEKNKVEYDIDEKIRREILLIQQKN